LVMTSRLRIVCTYTHRRRPSRGAWHQDARADATSKVLTKAEPPVPLERHRRDYMREFMRRKRAAEHGHG